MRIKNRNELLKLPVFISNSQNNGTGGNDGLECVTPTGVVNLTCVATLTSVVNIML